MYFVVTLFLQHDPRSREDNQLLKPVETYNVDYEETTSAEKLHPVERFAVSESGAMGIPCSESPSISIRYPGSDKSPVVLSKEKPYHSAAFVKISNREYLAAACSEDGCLYLWDIESKMSKKVFDPELSHDRHCKYMNVFNISDNTIGYGETRASSGGSRRVFILKTSIEDWTLIKTLKVHTLNNIWDICCAKIIDGTACLLLCIPYGHRITALEMIGGKTRWEVGKEQMGEKFNPWSICTDGTSDKQTVYVADHDQNLIHLLSAEDGSAITSIDLRHYGIAHPFTVKVDEEYLYVEHYKNSGDKNFISRFKKEL